MGLIGVLLRSMLKILKKWHSEYPKWTYEFRAYEYFRKMWSYCYGYVLAVDRSIHAMYWRGPKRQKKHLFEDAVLNQKHVLPKCVRII